MPDQDVCPKWRGGRPRPPAVLVRVTPDTCDPIPTPDFSADIRWTNVRPRIVAIVVAIRGRLPDGSRNRRIVHQQLGEDLVSATPQTGMDAAHLDLWAGVDHALPDDGIQRVAGMARFELDCGALGPHVVCDSVGAEHAVVGGVLRHAENWAGIRRDSAAVDDDHCDHGRLLLPLTAGRMVADSLYCVGRACVLFKFPDLADELKSAQRRLESSALKA